MEKISELISRVFLSRDMAHLEHWKTRSYATHEALGAFYGEAPDKLDGFIECYQGLFGLVKFKENEDLEEELEKISDITEHLQSDVKWIVTNRDELSKSIPALENILDELVDFYSKTIYKLRFLS